MNSSHSPPCPIDLNTGPSMAPNRTVQRLSFTDSCQSTHPPRVDGLPLPNDRSVGQAQEPNACHAVRRVLRCNEAQRSREARKPYPLATGIGAPAHILHNEGNTSSRLQLLQPRLEPRDQFTVIRFGSEQGPLPEQDPFPLPQPLFHELVPLEGVVGEVDVMPLA
jgi:hypothetical protein